MVLCRKYESVHIFRIIKAIDEDAIITQSNVNGIYGFGFDQLKVNMHTKKHHKGGEGDQSTDDSKAITQDTESQE